MTYELNQEQFKAVIALPDAKRFYHFISRIVDWEEVWSLKADSGWATVESEGRVCIPFWPHPNYAESFSKGDWHGYKPEVIYLNDFTEKWLPGLEKDNQHLAVFPNQNMNMKGIVVEAHRVQLAINEELEQY